MKYKLFLLVGFSIFLFSMAMQAQEPQPELAPPPEEEDALRPETMKDPFVVAATPVSEEQKAEALQFLGELVPEAVPALAELENEKPHAYERELRQALREKEFSNAKKYVIEKNTKIPANGLFYSIKQRCWHTNIAKQLKATNRRLKSNCATNYQNYLICANKIVNWKFSI